MVPLFVLGCGFLIDGPTNLALADVFVKIQTNVPEIGYLRGSV